MLQKCLGCLKSVGHTEYGSFYTHRGWCPIVHSKELAYNMLEAYEKEEGKIKMRPIRKHLDNWYNNI